MRSIRRSVLEASKELELHPNKIISVIEVLEQRLGTRKNFTGRRKVLQEIVEACKFDTPADGSKWTPLLWEEK
jgi:hypothetical protein